MSRFDDIINLPHPVSKKHPRMSNYNRGAQFAPFAALVGYDKVIDESGRMTDEKLLLDEYQIAEINTILVHLKAHKNVRINIVYFKKDEFKKGGKYLSKTCNVLKIDDDNQTIILSDNTIIKMNDIMSITLEKENYE
ncbi:MAG: hypothetical protein Q4B60_02095 [Erysipelotrichaceae bacterium]|nr:hypothetical protein [Erysipelotrichaceae bacterium]